MTAKNKTLYFLVLIIVIGCTGSPQKSAVKSVKVSNVSMDSVKNEMDTSLQKYTFPENVTLFSLLVHTSNSANEEEHFFISISEQLIDVPAVDEEDLIPLTGSEADSLEVIPISHERRAKLLRLARINEKQNVYLYNYKVDRLVVFPLKKLKTAAILNGYASKEDAPFNTNEYHLGILFDTLAIKELNAQYGDGVVVTIADEMPFVRNQMHKIRWKTESSASWPNNKSEFTEKQFVGLSKNKPVSFQLDSLVFWVKDWGQNPNYRSKRQLIILNKAGKKLLETVLVEDEGCSMAPLNSKNKEYENESQWAGLLIKDAGPMYTGFVYFSFSCEYFGFTQFPKRRLYLNCDSRH